MKLGIYAICKNENAHIDTWLKSVQEADEVVIVDTGSTDGTWEKLQQSGVKCVQKIFNPMRFDEARNYALNLLSEDCDICLPLDPDMYITNGYSEKIKAAWSPSLGILNLPMYYNGINEGGSRPCHARNNCYWVYPNYEQLRFKGNVKFLIDVIIIHNYQKGKIAHQMAVELAKLGMEENPHNPYCKTMYEQALKDYGELIKN